MTTRTVTLTPEGGGIVLDPNQVTTWDASSGARGVAVTDGSDSTFITGDTSVGETITFTLTTAALSGVVSALRVGLRHKKSATGNGNETFNALLYDVNDSLIGFVGPSSPTTSIATHEVTYLGSIARFTQALVDGMKLRLVAALNDIPSGTANWLVYECYVELDIDEEPPGVVPLGF